MAIRSKHILQKKYPVKLENIYKLRTATILAACYELVGGWNRFRLKVQGIRLICAVEFLIVHSFFWYLWMC